MGDRSSHESATLARRYTLLDRVARGGMAAVYTARDEVLARVVAVKVLHPSLGEDEAFLDHFRREALAAAGLAHPNIVAIYDTGAEAEGTDNERHFIVMEYCAGGTLADMLRREGPLEPARVVAIGRAICDALGHAHRHGIVHRDVKPANILFTEDGTLKVADFGIARAISQTSNLTKTGAVIGTAAYLSPEQARSEEPDARSDIYALGVVLYEMLTGRPPFVEDSQVATALRHVKDPPPPPRSLRAGIPRALEDVVLRALHKDPDKRYASAEALKAALHSSARLHHEATRSFVPPSLERAPEPAELPSPSTPAGETVRSLLPVIALIAAAILLIFAVPRLFQEDTGGGNGSGRNGGSGGDTAGSIQVQEVSDFDPYGGDGEHPEDAPAASDGNPATTWTTQDYRDPIQAQKPGVGLLFDLGQSVEVTEVEVSSPIPGYTFELRAADSSGSDEDGFNLITTIGNAEGDEVVEVDGERGRYWLVWITELPGGGGGSASISEVRFFGS